MSDYRSWRPIYQAMCPEPARDDVVLVILANGVRVDVRCISEWEYWWEHGHQLASEHEFHLKVLPMTASELMNFYGFTPEPGPLRPMAELKERDPEFFEVAKQNFKAVLFSDRASPDERKDALNLLKQMGALQ